MSRIVRGVWDDLLVLGLNDEERLDVVIGQVLGPIATVAFLDQIRVRQVVQCRFRDVDSTENVILVKIMVLGWREQGNPH